MARSFGAESLGADGFAVRGPVSAAPSVGCALVELGSNQLGWSASPVALNSDLTLKVSKLGDTFTGDVVINRTWVGTPTEDKNVIKAGRYQSGSLATVNSPIAWYEHISDAPYPYCGFVLKHGLNPSIVDGRNPGGSYIQMIGPTNSFGIQFDYLGALGTPNFQGDVSYSLTGPQSKHLFKVNNGTEVARIDTNGLTITSLNISSGIRLIQNVGSQLDIRADNGLRLVNAAANTWAPLSMGNLASYGTGYFQSSLNVGGNVAAGGTGAFTGTLSSYGNITALSPSLGFYLSGMSSISSAAVNTVALTGYAAGAFNKGVTLDLSTDGTLAIKNRVNNADAALTAGVITTKTPSGTYIGDSLLFRIGGDPTGATWSAKFGAKVGTGQTTAWAFDTVTMGVSYPNNLVLDRGKVGIGYTPVGGDFLPSTLSVNGSATFAGNATLGSNGILTTSAGGLTLHGNNGSDFAYLGGQQIGGTASGSPRFVIGSSAYLGFANGAAWQTVDAQIVRAAASSLRVLVPSTAVTGSFPANSHFHVTDNTAATLHMLLSTSDNRIRSNTALSFAANNSSTPHLSIATSGAATFAGAVTSSALVEGASLRANGYSPGASGPGVELLYLGGNGYLISYDRTTLAYRPLEINATSIYLGGTVTFAQAITAADNSYIGGSIRFYGSTGINTIWQSNGAVDLSINTASSNVILGAGTSANHLSIAFPSGDVTIANKLNVGNTITQGALDARWTVTATGKRDSQVGNGAGTWQTGYREEYNAGGIRCAFFGLTPVAQQSIAAVATDPATTQTLANSLRTAMLNLGLAA